MQNVRLAGDHLCRKLLFTWLSLVMSMMVSFELSFFPRDYLDEIWDLIESVSEGFPTFSECRLSKNTRGVARRRPGSTGFNKFPSVLNLNARFSVESTLLFCLPFQ